MARYLTVAAWVHRPTGRRVEPGEMVELTEQQAAGLIEAGCLVAAPVPEPESAPADGDEAQPPKPQPRKRR